MRLTEPGRIRVFLKLKAGNLLAALPGKDTGAVLQLIADVYPGMEPAASVMQTSLQNANPIIHPAVTLANAARIETTGGDFLFYEEGVIAIAASMGITVIPDPELAMHQGYMLASDYGHAYRTAPGFRGIGAQPGLDHRYLNEDVGYGLVFMAALGRQLGTDTPTMDAVIQIASVMMSRDYAGESLRSPESLGIAHLSAGELGSL